MTTPNELASAFNRPARRKLVAMLLEVADADELAAIGVDLVRALDRVAKDDPAGASRVADAVYHTFASSRRESPTSLSDTLEPTEPVPSGPPGAAP